MPRIFLATAGACALLPALLACSAVRNSTKAPVEPFSSSARGTNAGLLQNTADLPLPPAEGEKGLPVDFNAAIYFWVPMMDGSVTVGNMKSDVTLAFGDVIDLLDNLDGGFMGHLEAQFGDLGIILDTFFIQLEDESGNALATTETELQQAVTEFALSYRVLRWNRASDGIDELDVEAILGGRWNHLNVDVDVAIGAQATSRDRDLDWVDPLVGARSTLKVNESFSGWLRGDIGGFGLGNASDFTWQAIAGLNYLFQNGVHLNLGYRALDIDFDTSSFEYDMLIHGPFLGLGIVF
jgi:opacity protein-like surface antigen